MSTLVKLTGRTNGIDIETISRGHKSEGQFYILRNELEELAYKERKIVKDFKGFADMHLRKTRGGVELVSVSFYWLSESAENLNGWTETVQIPLGLLLYHAGRDGSKWKGLSFDTQKPLCYEFHGSHLHDVISNPILRHKFSKFLSENFKWPDAEKIVIWNDWEKYDFYFEEYTPYEKGICGGIILHDADDLRKASYSLHT